MKPASFHYSCIVTAEQPYALSEPPKGGNYADKGTLQIGRVVWLEHSLEDCPAQQKVRAYLDGVGIIQIDPAILKTCH